MWVWSGHVTVSEGVVRSCDCCVGVVWSCEFVGSSCNHYELASC